MDVVLQSAAYHVSYQMQFDIVDVMFTSLLNSSPSEDHPQEDQMRSFAMLLTFESDTLSPVTTLTPMYVDTKAS